MDVENSNDCLICLDSININDNFILCTNCEYYCHYKCSEKWFKTINTHDYYCIHCQQKEHLVVFITKNNNKNKSSSCIRTLKKILLRFIE